MRRPCVSRPSKEQKKRIKHVTVSTKDMKRLRNLQACLTDTQRRADKGFVLDSGATRTLVKQRAWLGRLMHRLKLTVRDAAGGCHDTQGTGDLTVRFLQKDGKFRSLGDIGQATLVEGLMYNLLSVSQLCMIWFRSGFQKTRVTHRDSRRCCHTGT